MYGSYANQIFNPNFHGYIIVDDRRQYYDYEAPSVEGEFVVACSTVDLFLFAVISYEVLIFCFITSSYAI